MAATDKKEHRAKEAVGSKEVAKILRGSLQGLRSEDYNHLDAEPVAANYEEVLQDLVQATPRLNAQTCKRAAMQAFDATAQEAEAFGTRLAKTFQSIAERARKAKTFERTAMTTAFGRLAKAYWQAFVRQEPQSTRSTGQKLLRSQQRSLRKHKAQAEEETAGLPLDQEATPPPKAARRLFLTPWSEEPSPRDWAMPASAGSLALQLLGPEPAASSEPGASAPAQGLPPQVAQEPGLPGHEVPGQGLPAVEPCLALVPAAPPPQLQAEPQRRPARRCRAAPRDVLQPLRDVTVVHTVLSLPVRSYVQARTASPGSRRLIAEFRARDCADNHRNLAVEAARRIRNYELGYEAGRALRQELMAEFGYE